MSTTIFISHVTSNVNAALIKRTFAKLDLGTVASANFVKHEHGRGRSVYVDFSHWNTENPAAVTILEHLAEGRPDVRIVYDDPYFWKLSASATTESKSDSVRPITVEFNTKSPATTFSLGEHESYVSQLEAELYKAREHIADLEADIYDFHTENNSLTEQMLHADQLWGDMMRQERRNWGQIVQIRDSRTLWSIGQLALENPDMSVTAHDALVWNMAKNQQMAFANEQLVQEPMVYENQQHLVENV